MKTGLIGFFMAMAFNAMAQEVPPVMGKLPTPEDIKGLELIQKFQGKLHLPKQWEGRPATPEQLEKIRLESARKQLKSAQGRIHYLADGMPVLVPPFIPNPIPVLAPPPGLPVMPVKPL